MGQSEFTRHSGRQVGGDPMYLGRQEQDAVPPMFLHSPYMPQGDGTHGSLGTRSVSFWGDSKIVFVTLCLINFDRNNSTC